MRYVYHATNIPLDLLLASSNASSHTCHNRRRNLTKPSSCKWVSNSITKDKSYVLISIHRCFLLYYFFNPWQLQDKLSMRLWRWRKIKPLGHFIAVWVVDIAYHLLLLISMTKKIKGGQRASLNSMTLGFVTTLMVIGAPLWFHFHQKLVGSFFAILLNASTILATKPSNSLGLLADEAPFCFEDFSPLFSAMKSNWELSSEPGGLGHVGWILSHGQG